MFDHKPGWGKVVLIIGIVWGVIWILAGDYRSAGLNFTCAFWGGMYADVCEERR